MKIALINAPVKSDRYYTPEEIECWRNLHILRYQTQFRSFLSPSEFLALENVKNQQYGLLSLASSLLASGHQVSLQVPESYAKINFSDLISAEVVGISSITSAFPNALGIAHSVKEQTKYSKVLLGGAHAHYQHQAILDTNNQPFDLMVWGFAEQRLVTLLDRVSQGQNDFTDIAGLAYKDKTGKNVVTSSPELINLNEVPLPAIELIPCQLIGARVHTGYGCPYQCSFCQLHGAKRNHHKNMQNLRQELIALKEKKGTRLIYIGDPVLGHDLPRVQEISDLMNELGLHWQFQTRVNLVKPDLLEILVQDPLFCGLEIGIETHADGLLKTVKQGISSALVDETVKRIADAGINLLTYWMFGLPGMTADIALADFEKMAALIKEGILVHLNMMVPYPGSQFFEAPSKFGLGLETLDWREYYSGGRLVHSLMNPPLSREQLSTLYREGVLKLSQVAASMIEPAVKTLFADFEGITIYRGLF